MKNIQLFERIYVRFPFIIMHLFMGWLLFFFLLTYKEFLYLTTTSILDLIILFCEGLSCELQDVQQFVSLGSLEPTEYIQLYAHIQRASELDGRGQEGKREIIFKELVHMIVVSGKFKICRASWQLGNSGSSWSCSLESKIHRAGRQAGRLDTHTDFKGNLCYNIELHFSSRKPVFALQSSN